MKGIRNKAISIQTFYTDYMIIILTKAALIRMLFSCSNILPDQAVKGCENVIRKSEAEGFVNRFISITTSSLFTDQPVCGE